jgi:TM2 domain-containing membrane protein YozV
LSLGLNDNLAVGASAPEPRHKSAGLAFGLSFLIPGLGQFYCGKTVRGGMTFGFWLLGLVLCFAHVSTELTGEALVVMLVLWIFSFLDAYFTAIEINKGQDEQVDVQNPRVAAALNLLTAGFGYFYLGERAKGVTLFVVMQLLRFGFSSTGFWRTAISVLVGVVQLSVAADAYRIARRQVKEALGPDIPLQVENGSPPSRLPVQVPVVLACVIPVGFAMLVMIGLVLRSIGSGQHGAVATPNELANRTQAQIEAKRIQASDETPIAAVDLGTAVQDVQRVQRRSERTKEEIPNLRQDVRVLSATLNARKVDPSDAMVAHYFRAVALAMMNLTREHDGEAIDVPGARAASADLDRIINAKSVLTYVPEVTNTNAEYWAGLVARNLLHDEPAAYSYWEKCAASGHAGCVNNLASARVTGAGGQKVDVQEALNLHTSVYNSGLRYHCAGAFSALAIAEINYFTGVRRPGDDEQEWTKKAEGLLDQLEAAEDNRNACHRVEFEVEDFLFQLSRGHKDENILQVAVSRLDDDSAPTKAVIQFISGAMDEAGFDVAMNASKSEGERCSAYFDAMWFAELRGENAVARRYYQHIVEIGKFHCGEELAYAAKFKF